MGDYSSGDVAALPSTTANLDHVYDGTDLSNVGTNDTNYVNQTGSSGFEIHQYKDSITATSASVTWIGKSSLAPSSSKVQLQVYKVAAPAGWENVSGAGASNNVAAADTDFTLSGTITTADYLDSGVTTFRIYQAASAGLVRTDNFSSSESPLVTNWSTEADLNGVQTVGNNQVGGTGSGQCGAYWDADSFNANQYSQVLYVGDIFTGPAVRFAVGGTVSTGYIASVQNSTSIQIYKLTDEASFAAMGDAIAVPEMTSGVTVIRIEVSGTGQNNVVITLKTAGTSRGTKTDTDASTIDSGSPGVYCFTTHASGAWEGGNL